MSRKPNYLYTCIDVHQRRAVLSLVGPKLIISGLVNETPTCETTHRQPCKLANVSNSALSGMSLGYLFGAADTMLGVA
jgi:hypothetical protein